MCMCVHVWEGDVFYITHSLVPRPHPFTKKRVWWQLSWLCRVSSFDTEQPNEIALCHATMCSTDQPVHSLVPRLYPHLCCTTQVTWLKAFCWLNTTKKSLNGHQILFLVRGWGLGTRLHHSLWTWIKLLHMSESPEIPLVSFLLLAMYASLSSI